MHDIVFIFTGGTIDSYFDADKGIVVPHPRSIIPAYIEERLFLDPRLRFEYIQLCAKDSRDITNADRHQMVKLINEHPSDRFTLTPQRSAKDSEGYVWLSRSTAKSAIIFCCVWTAPSLLQMADGHSFN